MRFNHTMKLTDGAEIGGYSKSGSKPEWFLLFTPEQYNNNLKEVVRQNDIRIANITCRTTFLAAQKQLDENIERLEKMHMMDSETRPVKIERKIASLSNAALHLRRKLYFCRTKKDIELNMTDGCECSLLWDDTTNTIIGAEGWAYDNPIQQMQNTISEWEKHIIPFDEWLLQLVNELPDEIIENIGDYLQDYAIEIEQGHVPSDVTYWILKSKWHGTTPRQLFQQFVKEWPSSRNSKYNYREFFSILSDMLKGRHCYQ